MREAKPVILSEEERNALKKIANTRTEQVRRVKSKEELVERIYHYIAEVNQDPVIYRWKYKMDEISVS